MFSGVDKLLFHCSPTRFRYLFTSERNSPFILSSIENRLYIPIPQRPQRLNKDVFFLTIVLTLKETHQMDEFSQLFLQLPPFPSSVNMSLEAVAGVRTHLRRQTTRAPRRQQVTAVSTTTEMDKNRLAVLPGTFKIRIY